MADQTDEQKRYNSDVRETADTFRDEAQKVEPHKGDDKATRSVEGKVETTTKEK